MNRKQRGSPSALLRQVRLPQGRPRHWKKLRAQQLLSSTRSPHWYWRRQWNTQFAFTPVQSRHLSNAPPGVSVSSTIRRFSSTVRQRRPRSARTPTISESTTMRCSIHASSTPRSKTSRRSGPNARTTCFHSCGHHGLPSQNREPLQHGHKPPLDRHHTTILLAIRSMVSSFRWVGLLSGPHPILEISRVGLWR